MARRKYILLFLLGLLGIYSIPSVVAQEIAITLIVPELFEDNYRTLLSEFESQNPGIRVEIKTIGGFSAPLGGEDSVEAYLDNVEAYVTSADVVTINSGQLLTEATRAGYFLDLAPLVNSDASLDTADFFDAMYRSFHWDGGIWALPVSGEVLLLYYDTAVFDELGVEYPNENWTYADLENAIRTLSEYDSAGNVSKAGFLDFSGGNVGGLLVSLLGGDKLYDDSVIPNAPSFDNPNLETILESWGGLWKDGLLTPPGEFDINSVPFAFGQSFLAQPAPDGSAGKVASLLPGGRAALRVDGYAISSGTQNPEVAYALLKFLTNSPEAATSLFGGQPARRSLVGVEPGQSSGGFRFAGPPIPAEVQAVIDLAYERAVPVSETRFSDYIVRALQNMANNDLDAHTALQHMEEEANSRLAVADERRNILSIVVATPAPIVELAPGEIEIRFGATSFISPFPDADRWQQVAEAFAAADSEVGRVTLNTERPLSLSELSERYDCFYMPNNIVQTSDLGLFRSMDPLMSSDASFNRDDFVANSLALVQRDGQIWAYPISLQPTAITYDTAVFENAGVMLPPNDWTVSDFERVLRDLKRVLGEDIPFQPGTLSENNLLTLIAIYGGLPLDYRTNPPTINFTDPATVDAIRQVLDLAKNGYIKYERLINEGGRVFSLSIGDDEQSIALSTEVLNGLGFGGGGFVVIETRGGEPLLGSREDNTGYINYPRGLQYNAISYDLSAAYISVSSQYAEACYRFISYLAQNTDLFPAMPARRSVINSPELSIMQGEFKVAYYQAVDALTQQANTIVLPTPDIGATSRGDFFVRFWLNRAFDRYVLEDADLQTELQDAQVFTQGFLDCIASIPAFNPATDDFEARFQQLGDCAKQVDSTTESFFR